MKPITFIVNRVNRSCQDMVGKKGNGPCEARAVEPCGSLFCKASKSDKNRIGCLIMQLSHSQQWAGSSIFQNPN